MRARVLRRTVRRKAQALRANKVVAVNSMGAVVGTWRLLRHQPAPWVGLGEFLENVDDLDRCRLYVDDEIVVDQGVVRDHARPRTRAQEPDGSAALVTMLGTVMQGLAEQARQQNQMLMEALERMERGLAQDDDDDDEELNPVQTMVIGRLGQAVVDKAMMGILGAGGRTAGAPEQSDD